MNEKGFELELEATATATTPYGTTNTGKSLSDPDVYFTLGCIKTLSCPTVFIFVGVPEAFIFIGTGSAVPKLHVLLCSLFKCLTHVHPLNPELTPLT